MISELISQTKTKMTNKENSIEHLNILYNNIWTPAPEYKIEQVNKTCNYY